MPAVLILSSFVAASRVGGEAQVLALARLGCEPILIPTSLLGRHPGWGTPGGGPVVAETMKSMFEAVAAQGVLGSLAAVITGHFSLAEQVAVAAEAIAAVRRANPAARIIVDPVIGDDDKGLYVGETVARAIVEDLVPRADILAPNAWELGRLTGAPVTDVASAVAAARRMGRPVLVSSIPLGPEIGVAWVDADRAFLAAHARAASAPKGVGDLLTALFVASLVKGGGPADTLALAVGSLAKALSKSANANEIPVSALPAALVASRRVRLGDLA